MYEDDFHNTAILPRNFFFGPREQDMRINDTELTKALDQRDFQMAEKIIRENTDARYLDEGSFGRIPLTLVLSGDVGYYHLRLALLLVKAGANPNYFVPQRTDKFHNSSATELLISFYSSMSILCKLGSSRSMPEKAFGEIYGLHGETDLSIGMLKEQLMMLIDEFIACGANPNLVSSGYNSSIFHHIVSNTDLDIELIMKLHEAGGNFNQPDVHGNTPLMDYIAGADRDSSWDLLADIWRPETEDPFFDYINCANETMMWRAMLAGSTRVASELIRRGADPTIRAVIGAGRIKFYKPVKGNFGVSAIFAPLLQNSSPYLYMVKTYFASSLFSSNVAAFPFNITLLDKVMACSIFPVVDGTYLGDRFPEMILSELETILSLVTKFPMEQLVSQEIQLHDVALLMFGNLKSGLQQLCVRQIIHQLILSKQVHALVHYIADKENKKETTTDDEEEKVNNDENWDKDQIIKMDSSENKDGEEGRETEEVEDCLDEESPLGATEKCEEEVVVETRLVDQWDLVNKLTPSAIRCLVTEHLKLPPLLVNRFYIEAARLQLAAYLYSAESSGCVQGCDREFNHDFLYNNPSDIDNGEDGELSGSDGSFDWG